MSKLQGKIAVVTGASKGIGAGIAKELAASGAAVVVNYANDRTSAESVVDDIVAVGGRAMAVQGMSRKPPMSSGSLSRPGRPSDRSIYWSASLFSPRMTPAG